MTVHGPTGPRGRAPRRTRGRVLVAGAVAVIALGACGGGHGGSLASTPATAATSTPTSSGQGGGSGCGTAATSGSTTLAVTVADRERTVIVHVPTGYGASSKVPLVLNMHGSGSTAAEQEAFTAMDGSADSHGFIVAYPQGLIAEGSGFDWNVPGEPLVGGAAVPAGSADDVTFLTTLVHILEQRYCIDSDRVYATGFSGGSRVASQLACDASGTFAAIAPVSGLRHPTPCPTTRPVPVLTFHGTADPVDPYGGQGEAYWTYSVPQAARDWAAQDGCSSAPTTSPVGGGVTLTHYTGCAGGATVELYAIAGEGHEWPGGPVLARRLTRVLGPQSDAIDADNVMWAFFAAHPM
ncbi:MAG: PHB depolymerase family esterase [Acidimicrobiales bacterium]